MVTGAGVPAAAVGVAETAGALAVAFVAEGDPLDPAVAVGVVLAGGAATLGKE
jgi:hypothetical protein